MDSVIMLGIRQETERAIAKHGRDSVAVSSWERVGCILGEECGELQEVCLDMTRPTNPIPEKEGLQRMYDEALQVASVAVRIMDRCRIRAFEMRTCKKCGGPKEETRPNSNLCRKCDHGGANVKPAA